MPPQFPGTYQNSKAGPLISFDFMKSILAIATHQFMWLALKIPLCLSYISGLSCAPDLSLKVLLFIFLSFHDIKYQGSSDLLLLLTLLY